MITTSLGKYRIKKWLGGGAFGDVYLATDTLIDRDFALKVSRLRKKDIQILKEEARLLSSLNHPNIVRFYNVDEIDGKLVLVMEYVPGSSLRDLLEKGRLDVSMAVDIAIKVLEGLKYAHSLGMIHRDIKPENILIDGESVKITDFGLARFIKAGSLSASMAGTPLYMAPEVWRGEISFLSDIYSVGVVLYESLTGQNPFIADSLDETREKILSGISKPPSFFNPSVTAEIDECVMSAVSPEPSRRPGSAEVFISLLRRNSLSRPFVPVSPLKMKEADGISLTPAQEEVVKTPEKRLLLIGSAGTGKTTALVHRAVHLLRGGTKPQELLILCFTRKAARDVAERIEVLIGAEGREVLVDTIHGFSEKLLRAEGERINIREDFRIVDPRKEKGVYVPLKKRFGNHTEVLLDQLSLAKSEGMEPDHFQLKPFLREFYIYYKNLLDEMNAMDFDDLLLNALKLLKDEVLGMHYRERFKHILVDEFQDLNAVQYEIVKSLTGSNTGIFITGDDIQSIYGWRGARKEFMRRVLSEIPGIKVVKLTASFRLPEKHIQLARNLMSRGKGGSDFLSDLPSASMKEIEGRIEFYKAASQKDEADFVCSRINDGIRRGRSFSDFAVLFRSAHYSREFEERFLAKGIPYTFIGMKGFYLREEVKRCVDLLEAIERRDRQAVAEGLNWMVRTRKSGFVFTGEKIDIKSESEPPSHLKKALEFVEGVMERPEEWSPADLLESLLKMTKFEEKMRRGGAKGVHVLENLTELVSSARRFGKGEIEAFVNHAKLLEDLDLLDWKKNSVRMLTVHSAKGLEFPVVFIVGLFENMFPLVRSIRSAEEVEEERRLLYVAITRSTEELYLSFPLVYRFGPVKPSRYLIDMAGM